MGPPWEANNFSSFIFFIITLVNFFMWYCKKEETLNIVRHAHSLWKNCQEHNLPWMVNCRSETWCSVPLSTNTGSLCIEHHCNTWQLKDLRGKCVAKWDHTRNSIQLLQTDRPLALHTFLARRSFWWIWPNYSSHWNCTAGSAQTTHPLKSLKQLMK